MTTESAPANDHLVAIEAAVVGTLMLERVGSDHIAAVLDECEPADFFSPAHAAVVAAVAEMHGDLVPASPPLVAERLAAVGSLDLVGGLPALISLMADAPAPSSAVHHARSVRRQAARRKALMATDDLMQALRADGDHASALADLEAALGNVGGVYQPEHLRTGDVFVLDSPITARPVWGKGEDVLWSAGEPLWICGPSGVGKSTLAVQVTAGRLGLMSDVLGYPVDESPRPVLYLAMDRPSQLRRAMRRLFDEGSRAVLAERLIIHEGPLSADSGRAPQVIPELARRVNAGTVIIDSAKDAAVKLTDDEVAGNFNRALQHLVADGREVLVLHHQRKGQGGARPTSLEDVYGSTWLTAGAGSVILLWGAAGDPLVDLKHLKQPAGEVGPLRIEHDHATGRSSVFRGVADPLVALRNSGSTGLTAPALAKLMFETNKPTDTQHKKAQRKLDALVRTGHAHRAATEQQRADSGSFTAVRYLAAAPLQMVSA